MKTFYRFLLLEEIDGCIHTVTHKEEEQFYSASLALHTGQNQEQIIANRKILESHLAPYGTFAFVTAQQTHSDHVHIVRQKQTRGWYTQADAIADCDALITDQKGIMLCILTADCVPILLCDPKKEVVAAVHAGWRGTEAKIVVKTVKKMQTEFGCTPSDIVAGIGPAIGSCCYEVGEDVAKHFRYRPNVLEEKDNGKYMLNLPLENRLQLMDAGLLKTQIEQSGICTACNSGTYFSYRKEQGCSGRFMSLIGLTEIHPLGYHR